MKIKINEIIICLIVFLVIYFEQISLGAIKLSYWKLPVILLLFVYCIKRQLTMFGILSVAIMVALKLIFNLYFYYGFDTITEAIYILVLPISLGFFYNKYRYNYAAGKRLLILMSSFFLISALPFILKIISQSREVSLYEGDQENLNALTGIFYHMSTSSQIFVISTIIILFNREFFKVNHIIWLYYFLIILGIYCVYAAYTRTGWLLLLFGFILYFKSSVSASKFIITSINAFLVISFVGSTIITSIDTNSFFYKRLIGESNNTSNEDMDLNTLSSGRLIIYAHSIEGVITEGLPGILLGIGKNLSTEKNYKLHGVGYVAHNKFIEIFCYGGLIALFLYILYVFRIAKAVYSIYSNNSSKPLLRCLFIFMLITLLPSHGFNLYCDFMFGLALALGLIENNMITHNLSLLNKGTNHVEIIS